MALQPRLALHKLGRYQFGVKEAQLDEDPSVEARLARLKSEYATKGCRRTVDAVLLVHEHSHPHLLCFQIGGTFFKLPSDELHPGEDVIAGLKRVLDARLSPVDARGRVIPQDWSIGECLNRWYRPQFSTAMYPYLPAHITKPKEERFLYLVHLPPSQIFSIPSNLKLTAVPLFELYENNARYGAIIASIPAAISRFSVVLELESDSMQQDDILPPPPPIKEMASSDSQEKDVTAEPPKEEATAPKKRALIPEPDEMQIAIDDDDD